MPLQILLATLFLGVRSFVCKIIRSYLEVITCSCNIAALFFLVSWGNLTFENFFEILWDEFFTRENELFSFGFYD